MKPLLRFGAALALAGFASLALAHAKLKHSIPANGANLAVPPSELRLTYNEAVEPAMSSVTVRGPEGKPVAIEKAVVSKQDDKVLSVPLPQLAPGAYRVEWSTMGHDGHATKGALSFTVK